VWWTAPQQLQTVFSPAAQSYDTRFAVAEHAAHNIGTKTGEAIGVPQLKLFPHTKIMPVF